MTGGVLYCVGFDDLEENVQDWDWVDRMKDAGLGCGDGCGSVHPSYFPRPVDVQVQRCPRKTYVPKVFANLFRKDFFELVSPHLRGAVVGRCIKVSHGKRTVCEDHVSCYSDRAESRLVLRGGPGSRYETCDVCGRDRSSGSTKEPRYILSHQLDGRLAYQEGVSGTFLLTQQLVDEIDWTRFPDLSLYPYPVFDRPIDGQRLPGDPDWDALPPVPEGGPSHLFGLGTRWEEPSLHGPAMVPHKPWLAEAKQSVLCRRCGKVDRTRPIERIDAVVEPWDFASRLEGHFDPVRRLSRTGVVIFQREVLDAIGAELSEAGARIGAVSLPDGRRIEELATCVLPEAAALAPARGGELKSCERCGARWPGRGRQPGSFPRTELPKSRVVQDLNGDVYVEALLVPRFHDLTYHGLAVDNVVPVTG